MAACNHESRVVYASLSSIYVYRRRVLINLDNKKTFIVYWAITSILNLLIYHQVNCGKQIACCCYIFFSHNFLSLYGTYTCNPFSTWYIFFITFLLCVSVFCQNVALGIKWCSKTQYNYITQTYVFEGREPTCQY